MNSRQQNNAIEQAAVDVVPSVELARLPQRDLITANSVQGTVSGQRLAMRASRRACLMGLVGIICAGTVWQTIIAGQSYQRRASVHSIWSLGGYIKRGEAELSIGQSNWKLMIDRWLGVDHEPPVLLVRLAGTAANDSDLKVLRRFSRQRTLDLRDTLVTDAGLEQLASLSELQVLILTGTAIGDKGLRQLAPLRQLEVLSLEETAVTDAGLEQLAQLPRLEWLNLSGTRVTDEGLVRLAECRSLKVLVLENCPTSRLAVDQLRRRAPHLLVFTGDTRRPFLSFLSAY